MILSSWALQVQMSVLVKCKGFKICVKLLKSPYHKLVPQLKFLGLEIDTIEMVVRVPQEKVQQLAALL